MLGVVQRFVRSLDAAYESRSYFVRAKARALAGCCAITLVLATANIAKVLWLTPPWTGVRVAINVGLGCAALLGLWLVRKGRPAAAGNTLVLGAVGCTHALILCVPAFPQALSAGILLFAFDLVYLLLALVFATRAAAFAVLALVVCGRVFYHLQALQDPISGTLRFAADTLLRDGLLATGIVFALGVSLMRLVEASARRSEEALAQSRAVNENLERLVAERTRALEEAMARANEASRAKSDFLANMSHEIRTPLNGILASAELLQRRADLTPEEAEFVRLITDSGELLLHQLGDVLDFSKIEAGQLALESHCFELRALAKDCTALVAPQAERAGVSIACDLAPHLPAHVEGDSFRLRQVLLNLLSNAIKFTPRGGSVRLSVLASVRAAAPEARVEVCFEVSDNGIGIGEEALGKIFERFTQADSSTTRRYGGTGLGLAISSRLVAMMGGGIDVSSAPGAGSVFRFTVPLRTASVEPAKPSAQTSAAPLGLSILVVEDNAMNRRILSVQLDALGCVVRMACDGEEALAALEAGPLPDVVLMDCHMPVLNGWDATRRLRGWETLPESQSNRRAAARVPVVALTAAALPEERRRCEECGMNGFLAKPVKLGDLRQALESYVVRKQVAAWR